MSTIHRLPTNKRPFEYDDAPARKRNPDAERTIERMRRAMDTPEPADEAPADEAPADDAPEAEETAGEETEPPSSDEDVAPRELVAREMRALNARMRRDQLQALEDRLEALERATVDGVRLAFLRARVALRK